MDIITKSEAEADCLAINGQESGRAIWTALECAIEAGLSPKKTRLLFDVMLESLAEEVPNQQRALFQASAYEAIPMVHLSAVERAEIDRNAWTAYEAFRQEVESDLSADAADYAYDTARDARLLGAA